MPKRRNSKFLIFLKFFVFCFLFFSVLLFFLFVYYAKDLPRPEVFTERELAQSTKIYDRTGEVLLYELYGEERRTWVSLEIIPDYLKEAVVATEDANFYHHWGVDLKGVARAILEDFKIGKPIYGGSTITQQLIRSTFLSLEKTAERKIREIILTLELDRRYSKDQILEWYLNQIPFGQNTYGVEEASRAYFNKSVSELSLAQAATLTALIRAPYYLSPYGENKNELLSRKDYVLDRMVGEGYLILEEAEKAKREEIKFIERPREIQAPYFTLWVKQLLETKYGEEFLRRSGWRIYTTLDWSLQKTAEEVVKEGVERNKVYNAYNAGLVAISPKTGEVLAMTVGTGNYYDNPYPKGCLSGCLFDPQFNVTVGTEKNPGRQPGSAFKPFVYATAFKKDYDEKTEVFDGLTDFGFWGDEEYIPQNYDGLFRGWVSLRQGLSQSLNIPSIKVLYLIGLENKIENLALNDFRGEEKVFVEGLKESLKTANEMGITTLRAPLSNYGPAIVLGGGEVKLIEMVSAYGVFANDGLRVPSEVILKIEDSKGNVIEENKKTPVRILESKVARLIDDILSDNLSRAPMFGLNSPLYFKNYQVATKTGTTQDFRDGWTLGFTPSISVGVWVGNNNNAPMLKEPGVVVAGPIFHQFLEKVLLKYPQENFPKPE